VFELYQLRSFRNSCGGVICSLTLSWQLLGCSVSSSVRTRSSQPLSSDSKKHVLLETERLCIKYAKRREYSGGQKKWVYKSPLPYTSLCRGAKLSRETTLPLQILKSKKFTNFCWKCFCEIWNIMKVVSSYKGTYWSWRYFQLCRLHFSASVIHNPNTRRSVRKPKEGIFYKNYLI
jgi:hypothetical protein